MAEAGRLAIDLRRASPLIAEEIRARQPAGDSRPLREQEAASLLLRALGALSQRAKIFTMNIQIQGKPTALTLIPGASFSLDRAGKTIIRKEKINGR
jgi:hypothetical protein